MDRWQFFFSTTMYSFICIAYWKAETKVHLVKAMVFPVVMYGCESWTVKKAEHRRIDALEDSWEFLGLQGDPTSPS